MFPREKLKYLPPNLITCGGMVLGLASVWLSLNGRLEWAAWVIMWCALIDRLDGFVARLFKATSKMGMELDSFSDFTTFGIAPGIFVFSLFSQRFSESPMLWTVYLGVPIFVVAAALRLAKFNISTEKIGDKVFIGLPTTLCGVLISTGYLAMERYQAPPLMFELLPLIMVVLGVLMISTLKMPKLKRRDNRPLDYFQTANMIGGFVCGWLTLFPEYILFITVVYVVVGIGFYLVHPPELGATPGPASTAEPPLSRSS